LIPQVQRDGVGTPRFLNGMLHFNFFVLHNAIRGVKLVGFCCRGG
jgi:hypothetical protein